MRKRIISLLLCVVMVLSMVPGTVSAANLITETTHNTNADDGVVINKTSTYDPGTGNMTITLEAYTTGTVTLSTRTVPTDIVLVLDVSGSMQGSGMTSMKAAVKNFIDSTKAANDSVDNEADKHSISIIKFADDSYYNSSTPSLTVGNHRFSQNGNRYNYTELLADFTTVNGTGATNLKNAVDSLEAGGATSADYGLNLATVLLDARNERENGKYLERNKVVVFFADGEPNHSNGYDAQVAHDSVNFAATLKDMGAKVYTIGIFSGADSDDTTSNANKFMNYLSSNYPNAYGEMVKSPYSNRTSPQIFPGDAPYANTYYHGASTANLNDVFAQISSEVGHPSKELGTNASMLEVVSDYFEVQLKSGSTKPEISVYTSAYNNANGANTWAERVADNTITATLAGDGDTIQVKGFDYDKNYISSTPRDGSNYGKKLILEIVTKPDYAVIDAAPAGTFTDGKIPTNDTAAILDSSSTSVAYTASPKLPANTVIYKIDEGGVLRTVGTYYRFPGAQVNVLPKPTDTHTYTYSDWATSDATISSGSFTMPEGNVVLVSEASVKDYDITFEYRGFVPTGATGLPSPIKDIAVGTSVTLPGITAPSGYTFSGWIEDDNDVVGNNFTMPAQDLHFYGYFIPNSNTEYTVKHWFEKADSTNSGNTANYEQLPAHPDETRYGTTGDTVTAEPLSNLTGYDYNAGISNASATLAASGTILNLYYSRGSYNVYYVFTNDNSELTNDIKPDLSYDAGNLVTAAGYTKTYKYGDTVTVQPNATATGYQFSGWASATADVSISGAGDNFAMPAQDVVITGYFSPAPNKYVVNHWLMNADGNGYTKDHSHTFNHANTGDTVSAVVANHTGFSYDEVKTREVALAAGQTMSDTAGVDVPSAVVKKDGSLELNLYYSRNPHKVTYIIEGEIIPAGVTAPVDNNTYHFGQAVELADVFNIAGYTFHGWTVRSGDVTVTTDGSGKQILHMADADVVLYGSFTANGDTPYIVEHYFEKQDGSYAIDNTKTENLEGQTGTVAYAEPLQNIPGYSFNDTKTTSDGLRSGTITGTPTLTLKLYYSLTQHTVSYQYVGIVPAGADAQLPGSDTYKFGNTVTIAGEPNVPGYEFHEWEVPAGITVTDGKFTMPSTDVVITGHFEPLHNSYKIEHYMMGTDGTYPTTADHDYTITDVVTGQAVTASTSNASHPGFTFDAAAPNVLSGNVLPNGELVLKVYFAREQYEVSYQYDGTVPTGASALPETKTYRYGSEVAVAPNANATGYTFTGWTVLHGDTAIENGKFTMPHRDVVLHGAFNPNASAYTVEHYMQNADGSWPDAATITVPHSAGVVVGNTVTAIPFTDFTAYTYDEDKTDDSGMQNSGVTIVEEGGKKVPQGTVDAAGSLVLKLYYSRNLYDLSYEFTGTVPSGISAPTKQEDIPHGSVVDLADITAPAGYSFNGWYHEDSYVGDSLTMPAKNTVVTGSFTPKDNVKYRVEYWLQDLNGSYSESTADSYERTGTTGAYVAADRKDFTGFTFNMDHANSKWNGHIAGDGSLVLKLYYDRNVHNVIYYYYGTPPADVTITQDGATLSLSGANPVISTAQVKYGQTFTVASILEDDSDDFAFRGWFTPNLSDVVSTAENAPGTSFTMPDHDVKFHGVLTTYYVVYDLDGGKFNGADSIDPLRVGFDHANLLPDGTPVKGGMRFTGWKYEDVSVSSTTKYSELASDFTVPYITLKAQYVPVGVPVTEGSVKLTKVDGNDSATLLPGAVFELYKADGTLKGSYTTDAKGEIKVEDLPAGDYYFVETRSPAGYMLDNAKYEFSVKVGKTTEITVKNYKASVPSVFSDDHYAYVIGYTDGTVKPANNITRAEVATIFFRLLDDSVREKYMTKENPFSDVKEGSWFNAAISTMSAMGIINGYPDGTFNPNGFITRAEFAAIAARFDESGNSAQASFKDIYGHWAHKEINTAAANGWVLGYEDGTFMPQQLITRAEAMTMVNRVLQRIPESEADLLDNMVKWPDNADSSKWYYLMIQEATNSHHYERKANGYEYWTELREVRDWAALEK